MEVYTMVQKLNSDSICSIRSLFYHSRDYVYVMCHAMLSGYGTIVRTQLLSIMISTICTNPDTTWWQRCPYIRATKWNKRTISQYQKWQRAGKYCYQNCSTVAGLRSGLMDQEIWEISMCIQSERGQRDSYTLWETKWMFSALSDGDSKK